MRERPPGSKRWELRAYTGRDPATATVDPATGKTIPGPPRQVSRVFHGGKREATKALHKLVQEVSEGQHIGTTATVGKLLDDYLKNLKRLKKARSTVDTYKVHIETHIRPALGTVRLDKLTPHVIDNYLAALEAKKLAPRTIRLNHAVLSAALTQAVDWGWMKANPAKRARLAAPERSTAPALTVDQLRTIYHAALQDDEDIAVTIALGALTGCRRGELCGLKWSDVDWEAGSLKVERQWVTGPGGQNLSTTTKGGKGRVVFIGVEGIALLRGYQDVKTEQIGDEPTGWLLSPDGGITPLKAKTVTDVFGRLTKKLKIPATFHTLRHFAATELSAAGVDLPTAAAQLGHSTAVLAGTYLHTSDERGAAAGELIAGIVGKALESGD